MEKVSIVIPCYNQAHYLPDAIESSLSQTYKEIEVIVVNDGSHDSTSDVAKRYKGVKLIEKENGHLSSARNAGIKAATGQYILPLDADDMIEPEFIEKTIPYLKDYDIVSTWLKTFGTENRTWGSSVLEPKYQHFRQKNHINCCSLFKKSMWKTVKGYDEFMKEGFEDWDFWRRCTRLGYKVRIVPKYLFLYRKHGRSMFTEAMEKRDKLIDYIRRKESLTGELIDIVYPLANVSKFGNNELKFSLRSVEKHMTGYRNIYVVGSFPRWGSHMIKHIKKGDDSPIKNFNILEKILLACHDDRISDYFLLMNDDYVVLKYCDAVTYPAYYSNEDKEKILLERPDNDFYSRIIKDTERLIPDFDYFDIHKPIVIHKKSFIEAMRKYNPKRYAHGLLLKSIYCYYGQIIGTKTKDCILRTDDDGKNVEMLTKGHDVISYHDEAVNSQFIAFLDQNFPLKSVFEF
jgi:glycosyltransferase involved in cell wall biosynthesis